MRRRLDAPGLFRVATRLASRLGPVDPRFQALFGLGHKIPLSDNIPGTTLVGADAQVARAVAR